MAAATESSPSVEAHGPAREQEKLPLKGKRRVPWYLPRDIRYRRRLRFTREGKLFVFVTLGLGFAAVNTGTNLMYLVFGFMLSLIVLSGVLSEHVLRALAVERRLPQRAVAGEPALIELAVKNNKQRLVSYSVEIEDQAEDDDNLRRCYFLKIPPRGEQAASYRRVPVRRGLLRFSGFSIATRFPFALFEKSREVELGSELLVYPRQLPATLPDALLKEQGERSAHARGRGTETRELREYRQDDEVRMIHWRRSASLGKHVVRELEQEATSLLCLRIDNRRRSDDDARWLPGFEDAISRAAYLAQRALSRGLSVEICARGARSKIAASSNDLDLPLSFLALLAPVDEALPLSPPTRGATLHELAIEVSERTAVAS